jgi:hypothetical protein
MLNLYAAANEMPGDPLAITVVSEFRLKRVTGRKH